MVARMYNPIISDTYIIALAGGSGSGKTTFAEKIQKAVGEEFCSIFSMDNYYLPELPLSIYSEQNKPNYDHPEAFDWELLTTHLLQLKCAQSIEAPLYDFQTSSRIEGQSLNVDAKPVLIFEGILTLFSQEIRELSNLKCFLNVEADIRFTRRLHRDVGERGRSLSSVISQYYDTVRPMYQKFLAPQYQFADLIVGEEHDKAVDVLAAKIHSVLKEAPFNESESANIEQAQ